MLCIFPIFNYNYKISQKILNMYVKHIIIINKFILENNVYFILLCRIIKYRKIA